MRKIPYEITPIYYIVQTAMLVTLCIMLLVQAMFEVLRKSK